MLNQSYAQKIDRLILAKARKFGVELKDFVNMGNHIHFQVRIATRASFQAFLRSITNLIARLVTGARKGFRFGQFWDGLAFTRIISTLEETLRLEAYLIANQVERRNGSQARQIFLQALNKWIKKLKAELVPLYSVRLS